MTDGLKRLMHIGFWWERQKERDKYENPDVRRRIILRWILGRMESYGLD
jgi:hypothetical protein